MLVGPEGAEFASGLGESDCGRGRRATLGGVRSPISTCGRARFASLICAGACVFLCVVWWWQADPGEGGEDLQDELDPATAGPWTSVGE